MPCCPGHHGARRKHFDHRRQPRRVWPGWRELAESDDAHLPHDPLFPCSVRRRCQCARRRNQLISYSAISGLPPSLLSSMRRFSSGFPKAIVISPISRQASATKSAEFGQALKGRRSKPCTPGEKDGSPGGRFERLARALARNTSPASTACLKRRRPSPVRTI